jgi:uncharacterized phage protein gp47/JayE
MATLTLTELLAAVPLADWKARIVSVSARVGLKTTNWADGGFTRTVVALFAQFYAIGGDIVRIIAAGGYLDHAEGNWLTLLAWNGFGVERIQATYASAVGGITLTNTGGGLYVLEPGDLIVAHFTTKKTYRNTTGGTLSPGVGQKLTLDLVAEEAGSDSGATVGAITGLITTNLGVTVSNEVELAGLDEESDVALRQRCRDSRAASSVGGTKRAYEYFAKSAVRANGTSIGVTRVRVMPALGDGTLTVYIAGAGGAITAPDVAIVQAIFDAQVNPHGLDATAVSATNKPIDPPVTVWIPASLGLTTAEAQKAVHDALREYVWSLPIGGTIIPPTGGRVYWRALLAVAAGAIPGTLKAQMASEVDVTVADGEVPVWAGVAADVTVNQVP